MTSTMRVRTLAITAMIVLFCLLLLRISADNRSMKGGVLGKLVDSVLRTISFRQELSRRNRHLESLGFRLPKIVQKNVNSRGIPVMTQTNLAVVLIRARQRQQYRDAVLRKILSAGCRYSPLHTIRLFSMNSFYRSQGETLDFERSEADYFFRKNGLLLNTSHIEIQVALVALYNYGGKYSLSGKVMDTFFFSLVTSLGCPENLYESDFTISAAPGHPAIANVITQLTHGQNERHRTIWNTTVSQNDAQIKPLKAPCTGEILSCIANGAPTRYRDSDTPNLAGAAPWYFSVEERQDSTMNRLSTKDPFSHKLSSEACWPNWICNRCLKTDRLGTYSACTSVCPSCYYDIICRRPPSPPRRQVSFDVVSRYPESLLPETKLIPRIVYQTWFEDVSPDRYPHIARLRNSWKQSGWRYKFFTDSSARKWIIKNFPSRFLECFDALLPGAFKADFFRLLLLLREGGVYADVDVKLNANLDSFVTPNMGLFVPQDLVAGHRGANFCLWNGLMGSAPGHPIIVKAVERILNIVLNRGDYYDMEHDVCHSTNDIKTEVWKVRALDILLLTGPCALGVSANRAVGRENPVAKIDVGWLGWNGSNDEKEFGDTLILLSDKYDLGELRFTDPDRNLLVASTEHDRVTKSANENHLNGVKKSFTTTEKSHYSSPQYANDVFGAAGVYSDSSVTNEDYLLQIKY